jgi:hypothetical protein
MANHYGIITDLTTSPHETAQIDISLDTAMKVRFTVYAAAGPVTADVDVGASLATSSAASTQPNLFAASNGTAALVEAQTGNYAVAGDPNSFTPINSPSAALLRQRSGQAKNIVTLPREETSKGTSFRFPVYTTEQGTYLFLGAPDGDTSVTVSYGTTTQTIPILNRAVTKVQIGAAGQTLNTEVNVTATVNVIAILGIDTGKVDETILLPT